ncbi:homocysteine S-methyltransferase family protein [Polymorphospora rubra]|uniref:homocysteine S-methyltransferase family protein n=1 Tax=Polymorphospora rubra TaxID=338584 RepID=UPI001BB44C7D|nr:homocysteine S-methyltransferase family protein [Polymorphospora rubra]
MEPTSREVPVPAARPTLLDGAMATELQRHGRPMRPPLWSSEALGDAAGRVLVRDVHERYLTAGADVVTANTLRCNRRTLDRAGLDDTAARRLVEGAVRLAVAARDTTRPAAWVAGSIGPAEDCYRPELVPPDAEIRAEARWLAEQLVGNGVDLLLVETVNTAREAMAALAEARATGVPVWVSLVCGPGARLLSGEPLAPTAARLAGAGATAVLVNCTGPAETGAALAALASALAGTGTPFGAYPNVEDRSGIAPNTAVDRYVAPHTGPAEFGALVAGWSDRFGLSIVGGCCGTTPAHVEAVAARSAGTGAWLSGR